MKLLKNGFAQVSEEVQMQILNLLQIEQTETEKTVTPQNSEDEDNSESEQFEDEANGKDEVEEHSDNSQISEILEEESEQQPLPSKKQRIAADPAEAEEIDQMMQQLDDVPKEKPAFKDGDSHVDEEAQQESDSETIPEAREQEEQPYVPEAVEGDADVVETSDGKNENGKRTLRVRTRSSRKKMKES